MRKGSIKKQNGVHASTPHTHTHTHTLTQHGTHKSQHAIYEQFFASGPKCSFDANEVFQAKVKPSCHLATATLTKAAAAAAAKTESGGKKERKSFLSCFPQEELKQKESAAQVSSWPSST